MNFLKGIDGMKAFRASAMKKAVKKPTKQGLRYSMNDRESTLMKYMSLSTKNTNESQQINYMQGQGQDHEQEHEHQADEQQDNYDNGWNFFERVRKLLSIVRKTASNLIKKVLEIGKKRAENQLDEHELEEVEEEEEQEQEQEQEETTPENDDFTGNTWDPVTTERIASLAPHVQEPATIFINRVEAELGIQLRVMSAHRSFEEQDALYEQGRTTPGKIVTNAQGGESHHNYGLAIDVVIMENGQPVWEPIPENVAQIAQELGFRWGAEWDDPAHFQMGEIPS